MRTHHRTQLLSGAAGLALLIGGGANAQTAGQPEDEAVTEVEEIVVGLPGGLGIGGAADQQGQARRARQQLGAMMRSHGVVPP